MSPADGCAAAVIQEPARVWSPYQEAVFADVADRSPHHLIVEAVPGSGKTTTAIELLCRTPESSSAISMAFNKEIAAELARRLPEGVEGKTFHGFGLATITRHQGRRQIDGDIELERIRRDPQLAALLGIAGSALQQRADSLSVRAAGNHELAAAASAARKAARNPRRIVISAVRKLVSLAKGSLVGDSTGLERLIEEFEIMLPPGEMARAGVIAMVQRHLQAAGNDTAGPIDFDDMIWLPVTQGLAPRRYDWVVGDEIQDLNPAQLRLVELAVAGTGRFVGVGDRRQAIYAFRGADSEAIPRMVQRLKARTLPLSICYRCGAAIVAEAAKIAPEIEAAPEAPPGIVRYSTPRELQERAAPGDFVISRTNAPLVSLAYGWLAAGRRAFIRGRDVGSSLAAWIEDSGASTREELMGCIGAWEEGEVERLESEDRDTEAARDRAECLRVIARGSSSAAVAAERVRQLFQDDGPGSRICLSTTHRAKGLEAPRVWMLADTYRSGTTEEDNLRYVAITRAQHELIYVTGK